MVADNAVEGTGSELNAKAGRRALLLGYPAGQPPGLFTRHREKM